MSNIADPPQYIFPIVVDKHEDGIVCSYAPDYVRMRKRDYDVLPIVEVVRNVVYLDTINPKLYTVVLDADGMIEMRRKMI